MKELKTGAEILEAKQLDTKHADVINEEVTGIKEQVREVIKTGEQIKHDKDTFSRSESAEEMAKRKKQYTHTKTEDLENGCPIGRLISSGCFDCDYTDIIGYCVYPVKINVEIAEGRALPIYRDPTVPEVIEDRKRQVWAFEKRLADYGMVKK